MLMKNIKDIETQDEARQIAIDWQNWVGEQDLSYKDLADWGNYFNEVAEKFGLQDEFKENGII